MVLDSKSGHLVACFVLFLEWFEQNWFPFSENSNMWRRLCLSLENSRAWLFLCFFAPNTVTRVADSSVGLSLYTRVDGFVACG